MRHLIDKLRWSKFYRVGLVVVLVTAAVVVVALQSSAAPVASKSSQSVAPTSVSDAGSASQVLGARTQTTGCHANGALPDLACTPGANFAGVTVAQICAKGYSSSVRDVSTAEKNAVYSEYGINSHTTGQYEVDHLVSLELGGSNEISNLWPEAAAPTPGFHEKDQVENYLHDQVCAGKIALAEAQKQEANNWLAFYAQISGTTPASAPTATPVGVAPPAEQTAAAPSVTPATTPAPQSATAGPTALCNDGTYSYSAQHQGTCSHHAGVASWYQ